MRFLFLCEYGYAFAMLYSRLKEGDQVQTDDIQTSVRDLYDGDLFTTNVSCIVQSYFINFPHARYFFFFIFQLNMSSSDMMTIEHYLKSECGFNRDMCVNFGFLLSFIFSSQYLLCPR